MSNNKPGRILMCFLFFIRIALLIFCLWGLYVWLVK